MPFFARDLPISFDELNEKLIRHELKLTSNPPIPPLFQLWLTQLTPALPILATTPPTPLHLLPPPSLTKIHVTLLRALLVV